MVSENTAGEAAIIFDVRGKVSGWEAALIELEGWRTIVASGDGIVEDDGV